MTINDIVYEARQAKDRFWFITSLDVFEQTVATVTLRFAIKPNLFVQVYYSERSGRFSLALIGGSGRLFGQDCEHGVWHVHPFENPDQHEPFLKGLSPQPVIQFLSEVEEILMNHELI